MAIRERGVAEVKRERLAPPSARTDAPCSSGRGVTWEAVDGGLWGEEVTLVAASSPRRRFTLL